MSHIVDQNLDRQDHFYALRHTFVSHWHSFHVLSRYTIDFCLPAALSAIFQRISSDFLKVLFSSTDAQRRLRYDPDPHFFDKTATTRVGLVVSVTRVTQPVEALPPNLSVLLLEERPQLRRTQRSNVAHPKTARRQ